MNYQKLNLMVKLALLGTLFMLLSTNSFSAEFGIGISANESEQLIYLPMKITNSLKTELSLQYQGIDEECAVGGEAEVYYHFLNDKEDDEDTKFSGTDSRIVLRYYF